MKKLIVILCCVVMAAVQGRAVDSAISAKVGTLGVGGEFTWRVTDNINIRAGLNMYDYEFTMDIEDTSVDAVLSLESAPFLIDYHPFSSGFRISAGAMYDGNVIELSAIPDELLVLNGIPFAVESMEGEVTFNKFAPYIGIGFGNAVLPGSAWQFTCDFGLMFHGKPKATASAVAANPFLQDLLDSALEDEIEDFNDDISGMTIWPVASVGISLNF